MGDILYRGIFSQKNNNFILTGDTTISALQYVLNPHFSSHKQTSNQSARKLHKLPGAPFCRFLSKSGYWADLSCSMPHRWFNAHAPPRKSESVSSHIQIFGGNKMDKTKLHEICVKKFFYVARGLPRYHVSLTSESDGKGVSA